MLGGLAVLKWRRVIWFHLPAAAWAAVIEFQGWICPLTPLENRLRQAGGAPGYEGGFIEHTLIPIVYPATLTREHQIGIGVLVIVVNLCIYLWVWKRA